MGIFKETINKIRVGTEIRTLRETNYELDLDQFYKDLQAAGATVDKAMFEAALLSIDKSITQFSDIVLVPGIYKSGSVFAFNGMTKSFEEFVFTRGSAGSYTDANGFLRMHYDVNMPRLSYSFGVASYLLEPASVNYALNSLNTYKKGTPVITALPARAGEAFTLSAIVNGSGSIGVDNGIYGTGINASYDVSVPTRIIKTFGLPGTDGAGNQLDGSKTLQINIWTGTLTMSEVQIEPGFFKTSHIPTDNNSSVRAAERLQSRRQVINSKTIPLIYNWPEYNTTTLVSLRQKAKNLFDLIHITGLSTLPLQAGKTYTFAAGAATFAPYIYFHIWPQGGSYGSDYNNSSLASTDGSLKVETFTAKGNAFVLLFTEVAGDVVFTYKPTLVEGTEPLIIKYDNELQEKTETSTIDKYGINPTKVPLSMRSFCILSDNQLP